MPLLKFNYSSLRFSLLALPLAVGIAACDSNGDGAAPGTVQQRLTSTLPGLIDNSSGALNYLSTSESWNGLGDSMDGIAGILGFAQNDSLEPVPAAGDEELSGEEIAQMLEEQLFNDSNYEGNGDYRFPSALLCPDIDVFDESDPSGFSTVVDQDCIDMIDAIEPRVHVEAAGNGLDFSLLIGPQRAAPLTLELREESIAIAADLAEAKAAAQHISSVAGEDISLPETMEGIAAASLTVNGPQDVSLAFSIRESLHIAGTISEAGIVDFSSATADPLLSVRVNGVAQELAASLDLGRTKLSMPYSMANEDSTLSDILAIDWQGLSAAMLLNDNSNAGITIDNVGFGDGQSTIKLGDATLLSVDLNADSGRHFSLSMLPGIAGALPSFQFDPGFSLDLGIDLSPLAAIGEDIPSYFLGETYSFDVESGAQLVEGPVDSAIMAQGGAIRLTSSAGTGDVEVLEGQCLFASDVTEGEHELLGAFEAGACP